MPNSTDFQTIVGIDIAKSVFQVYSCDTETGIISNEKIKRDRLLEHISEYRERAGESAARSPTAQRLPAEFSELSALRQRR